MPAELSLEACLEIIGKTIRLAILDYQKGKRRYEKVDWRKLRKLCNAKKEAYHQYRDAKHFLFSQGTLENFLWIYAVDEVLSVDYIRYMAEHVVVKDDDKLSYVVKEKIPEMEAIN